MGENAFITAVSAEELFTDHSYQRPLDRRRAKQMAATWDRRLAGIIEVSERPEDGSPRYAVIDGQHRVAAAALLSEPPVLVVNVHTGLTIADEAALFDRLNRQRRAPTTWDHWTARLASQDEAVQKIEKAVAAVGLRIDSAPKDGNVRCTSTLEKLAALGGPKLVEETLRLIFDCWGKRLDAYDAPIVHGLGLVLHYLDVPIDRPRLWESMLDVMPRQLKTQALALRDMTTGSQAKLVALAVMTIYNRRPGKKILVSTNTFGATARNAHSSARALKAVPA